MIKKIICITLIGSSINLFAEDKCIINISEKNKEGWFVSANGNEIKSSGDGFENTMEYIDSQFFAKEENIYTMGNNSLFRNITLDINNKLDQTVHDCTILYGKYKAEGVNIDKSWNKVKMNTFEMKLIPVYNGILNGIHLKNMEKNYIVNNLKDVKSIQNNGTVLDVVNGKLTIPKKYDEAIVISTTISNISDDKAIFKLKTDLDLVCEKNCKKENEEYLFKLLPNSTIELNVN